MTEKQQLPYNSNKSITILLLALLMGFVSIPMAATHYVNADLGYYQSTWPLGSIVQPSIEWRFASGLDYDTTGTGEYFNYGDSVLVNGLLDINRPGLGEGILSAGQSSLEFDGINDYLRIDDSGTMDIFDQSFTINVWMRTTITTGTILEKKISGTIGYEMYMSSGTIRFWLRDGNDFVFVNGGAMNDGKWHNVTAVCNWGDFSRIYVDGVQRNAKSISLIDSLTNTSRLTIGSSAYFNGNIDLIQIWKGTALSTSEVEALYNSMSPDGNSDRSYPSIQAAAYQADNGDSIITLPGDYTETIQFVRNVYTSAASQRFGTRPNLFGTPLPAEAGINAITVTSAIEIQMFNITGYTSGYGVYADSASDGSVFHHLQIDSCKYGIGFYGLTEADSIVNCTVDGAGLAGSFGVRTLTSLENGIGELYLFNNIFTGCSLGVSEADSFNMNAFYNDYWNNTVDTDGFAFDVTDLQLAPDFIDNEDYRLSQGSPLVNMGTALRFNFVPNAPDIGAWEFEPRTELESRPWGRLGRWGRPVRD